ncbi:MAG: signal recognition particle-docking protein FtsY, partial [Campylobacter sp.]|nr:signal recognition particle-docking protein FtsY [Campylobacter sp.]
RICDRAMPNSPHRKIIVLDGTQGNNSVIQAKAFNEIVRLDGIIITKLDGTPKGGALFGIARDLELPILYIGVGENMDDLVEFRADEFVDTLVEGIYA